MLAQLRPAVMVLVLLTLVTGVAYPLLVDGHRPGGLPVPGAGQPGRQGRQGRRLGAHRPALRRPKYFWSRPSATAARSADNAGASSGSNLSPDESRSDQGGPGARVTRCALPTPATPRPVPVDLVTGVGQRPRPAHQPRRGALPGRARGARPQARPDGGAAARGAAHRRALARLPRGAAGSTRSR